MDFSTGLVLFWIGGIIYGFIYALIHPSKNAEDLYRINHMNDDYYKGKKW